MTETVSGTPSFAAKLSIVIPAYNEEGAILKVLNNLRSVLPGSEIIVVDDGSVDQTYQRATAAEAVVLRHDINRGYGAALKTGMRAAAREYVVWFDADNEHRVEDLLRLVGCLERDRLVAVIGQRAGGVRGYRATGKALIGGLAWLFGMWIGSDINCGFRVFRRAAILPYLPLLPDRFSASMTSTMILAQRGYPIAFEPIELNERIGASKVKLKDGFEALVLVLRVVMLFAPLRIFLPLGTILVVVGGAYGTILAIIQGLGFPTLAVVAVLAGLILILQGLIADQISQMRLTSLEQRNNDEA